MIKFYNTVTVPVVESFDEETETAEITDEVFEANKWVDAEIIREENGKCELEFGDGGVAFSIPRDSFEVVA